MGKLVDRAGRPIVGARAGYFSSLIFEECANPSLADWKSNSAGEFRIGIDRFDEPAEDDTTRKRPVICFVHEHFVDLRMKPKWPTAKNPVVDLGTLVLSSGARILGTLEPLKPDPERRFQVYVNTPGSSQGGALVDVAPDGRFRIRGLPPGTYEIGAQAEGTSKLDYEVSTEGRILPNNTIELAEGAESRIQIRIVGVHTREKTFTESFSPRRRFSGRVLDGSGRPMASVNVAASCRPVGISVYTTDEEGSVVVYGPFEGDDFEVAVIQRSEVLGRKRLSVNGPDSFEVRVAGELTTPAVVLRIRDAVTGAPIRNATIRSVADLICGNDIQGEELRSAPRPDAREVAPGLYRVPFIPYGFEKFALGVRAPGFGSVHTNFLELSECQDYGPIDLAMPPADQVQVRVVNSLTGKPLVGSVVELDEGIDFVQNLSWILGRVKTTDASGCVRFDDIPAGTYRITIDQAQDVEFWTEEVVVERGKTKQVDAAVKGYAKLRIVVVDAKGVPIDPGDCTISRNGAPIEGSLGYHASAWYIFRSLDFGPCKVEVRGDGLGQQVLTADAELRSGEETSVVLRAKP